ncbi:MAG: orotate phosphoribosyltransferase, partial [Muribaculaceae bacterium]|nr:orotate phosphoribosyltransferase [Muribaculaceae bacterium]
MNTAEKVAAELLGIKAVFLSPANPFTWASGIKSPIYCDNRLILTSPEARKVVEEAIAATVKEKFPEAE